MTAPAFKWVNLFAIAQIEGFVYFKAFVNQATNHVAGWVTRAGQDEPYSYSIYFLDFTGTVQTGTRGTWQHADWAVQGAVKSSQPALPILFRPARPCGTAPPMEVKGDRSLLEFHRIWTGLQKEGRR